MRPLKQIGAGASPLVPFGRHVIAGWPAEGGVHEPGKIRRLIGEHYRRYVEGSVPDGLMPSERQPAALRVVKRDGPRGLADDHRGRLRELPGGAGLIAAMEAGRRDVPRRLDAVLRCADLLASDSCALRRAHLTNLQAQGLTIAEIAALARLVAFVAYQASLLDELNLPDQHRETNPRPREAAVAPRRPSLNRRHWQAARNWPS